MRSSGAGERRVRLQELAPAGRGDIIAAYLRAGGKRSGAQANAEQARYYFGLEPQATPADIAAIVDYGVSPLLWTRD